MSEHFEFIIHARNLLYQNSTDVLFCSLDTSGIILDPKQNRTLNYTLVSKADHDSMSQKFEYEVGWLSQGPLVHYQTINIPPK